MPLPTNYTNDTPSQDQHPTAHNQTNVAVNDHDTRLAALEAGGNVDTGDLADNAVTNPKLADNAVGVAELQDNAVTNAKLADNAVNTAEIADNAVTAPKIVDNAVTNTKILNSAVTQAKISANAVDNARVSDMATNTIKGRRTAATGDPEDLTPANARLVIASDSGGGTVNYLRADGTWAEPKHARGQLAAVTTAGGTIAQGANYPLSTTSLTGISGRKLRVTVAFHGFASASLALSFVLTAPGVSAITRIPANVATGSARQIVVVFDCVPNADGIVTVNLTHNAAQTCTVDPGTVSYVDDMGGP